MNLVPKIKEFIPESQIKRIVDFLENTYLEALNDESHPFHANVEFMYFDETPPLVASTANTIHMMQSYILWPLLQEYGLAYPTIKSSGHVHLAPSLHGYLFNSKKLRQAQSLPTIIDAKKVKHRLEQNSEFHESDKFTIITGTNTAEGIDVGSHIMRKIGDPLAAIFKDYMIAKYKVITDSQLFSSNFTMPSANDYSSTHVMSAYTDKALEPILIQPTQKKMKSENFNATRITLDNLDSMHRMQTSIDSIAQKVLARAQQKLQHKEVYDWGDNFRREIRSYLDARARGEFFSEPGLHVNPATGIVVTDSADYTPDICSPHELENMYTLSLGLRRKVWRHVHRKEHVTLRSGGISTGVSIHYDNNPLMPHEGIFLDNIHSLFVLKICDRIDETLPLHISNHPDYYISGYRKISKKS